MSHFCHWFLTLAWLILVSDPSIITTPIFHEQLLDISTYEHTLLTVPFWFSQRLRQCSPFLSFSVSQWIDKDFYEIKERWDNQHHNEAMWVCWPAHACTSVTRSLFCLQMTGARNRGQRKTLLVTKRPRKIFAWFARLAAQRKSVLWWVFWSACRSDTSSDVYRKLHFCTMIRNHSWIIRTIGDHTDWITKIPSHGAQFRDGAKSHL